MNNGEKTKMKDILLKIADSPEILEIGRKAIEDELVIMRDDRLSFLGRGNGLVIREKDGKDSSVIRLGPEDGLRIGLKAIANSLGKDKKSIRKLERHTHPDNSVIWDDGKHIANFIGDRHVQDSKVAFEALTEESDV